MQCVTDHREISIPAAEFLTREAALNIIAQVARLLFVYEQTTERLVVTAERLGRALGVPIRVMPRSGPSPPNTCVLRRFAFRVFRGNRDKGREAYLPPVIP